MTMSHEDQTPPAGQPANLPPVTAEPAGAETRADRTAPPPIPEANLQPTTAQDGILRPIQESDYFTMDPEAIQVISANIDRYFNQALDIFPFWETENKPDRFHVLYSRQIEERFPADEDIRGRIFGYGRRVFNALRIHVLTKRLTQGLALVGFAAMAILGPTLFAQWTGGQPQGLGLAVLGMLITAGVFYAVSAVLFVQYRFRLENDSYELSREIVQRTRELQNLFTNARALSDQAETTYANDGKAWGQRALFLTRLVLWLGARMEHLEKYAQLELWRVRRERYWMRWVGRLSTPLVLVVWLAVFAFWPAPAGNEAGFRVLQLVALALAVVVSWVSYARWRTPTAAVKDKLGLEGWVRYASLDLDNTIGDQVRRDKERLVEYRALTRGR
jgi:hypothetical protein